MRVPVRVLTEFEGATDSRGIHSKLFTPTAGGAEAVYLEADLAEQYAAQDLVEILDDDADAADSDEGSATPPAAGSGAPDGEDDNEALLRWLQRATGNPLKAWLGEHDTDIPSNATVPTLRSIALAVAERENDERGN